MTDEEMVGYNIDQDFNTKPQIHTEKVNQLCIYIRNYDESGNLLDSPVDAVKTCIDTYERSFDKNTWTDKKLVYNKDGSTKYEFESQESIQETINNLLLVDEEIQKVKPVFIDSKIFLNHFLRKYFDNYKINKNSGGKTLYIEFHNTSDLYTHYSLTYDDLLYFKSKNYDIMGLDLDNNTIIINNPALLELETFLLKNANVIIDNDSGIAIKAKDVFLESLSVSSEYKNHLSTFSLTISRYLKLQYISFKKDICKFHIMNPVVDHMQKWMQTKVDIYGISFCGDVKDTLRSYRYKLESLFVFNNIHTVNVNSVTYCFDLIDMTIMRFRKIMNVTIGSVYIKANVIEKTLIVLNSVTNCTACGITATQNEPENKRVYTIQSSIGGVFGEYKFVAVIVTHIGLFACVQERVSKVSFANSRCVGFSEPIRYLPSGTTKMIFSSCNFDKIAVFEVKIPQISLFDSSFTHIDFVKFTIGKKLYISNTVVSGKSLELHYLEEGTSLIENSKVKFKKLTILGENGKGKYNQITTRLICDEVDIKGIDKFATNDSDIESETFSLIGTKISGFNPVFVKNKLKSLSITGMISSSLIMIKHTIKNAIDYTFKNIKGSLNLVYLEEIGNGSITLDTGILSLNIDSTKELTEKEKVQIKLKCLNDCKKSVITSHKRMIELAPVAEGSFIDMDLFGEEDDLTKPKWKEKIAYGYKNT